MLKKSTADAMKAASKRVIQKIAEATGVLIDNTPKEIYISQKKKTGNYCWFKINIIYNNGIPKNNKLVR